MSISKIYSCICLLFLASMCVSEAKCLLSGCSTVIAVGREKSRYMALRNMIKESGLKNMFQGSDGRRLLFVILLFYFSSL